MKSKLFLSLSLLTAIFSMHASPSTDLEKLAVHASPSTDLEKLAVAQVGQSRLESAKASVTDACTFVSTKVTDACTAVSTQFSNGYKYVNDKSPAFKASAEFVSNHKTSLGIATVAIALGLVAYKYRDSIFGEAKKVAPKAPDVVKPVGRVVNFRPATRG